MAKIRITTEDHPHQSFEELICFVWECERLWRVYDRLDGIVAKSDFHKCAFPAGGCEYKCGCGTRWRREFGGGWTTA